MKQTFVVLAPALAVLIGCGGPAGGGDGGDAAPGDGAGADARPRNDRININCTSAMGDEGAVACNTRLGAQTMGSTFFIGPVSCRADVAAASCAPMCALTDMNPMNCSFVTANPGCAYDQQEGYAVVVETTDHHRAIAGVSESGSCPLAMSGRREYARVNLDDLVGAVACARITPMGGFGPERYGLCDAPGQACGTATGTPADMCTTLMFRDMMGPYSANLCTHMCSVNRDCGNRGTCFNGTCWALFNNICASTLVCPTGTSAYAPNGESEGPCLPLRPRN